MSAGDRKARGGRRVSDRARGGWMCDDRAGGGRAGDRKARGGLLDIKQACQGRWRMEMATWLATWWSASPPPLGDNPCPPFPCPPSLA